MLAYYYVAMSATGLLVSLGGILRNTGLVKSKVRSTLGSKEQYKQIIFVNINCTAKYKSYFANFSSFLSLNFFEKSYFSINKKRVNKVSSAAVDTDFHFIVLQKIKRAIKFAKNRLVPIKKNIMLPLNALLTYKNNSMFVCLHIQCFVRLRIFLVMRFFAELPSNE